eukprot:TRINITY_DN656_c5_g1_i1.p1 TRINITY_DN656_c5_g1~~TRINITY_DN656_c5_g1_i1.p1  ORF type:complete len:475 (+),score=159.23 TRINITY_DN656_c5_g1_i1:158-1582(+)
MGGDELVLPPQVGDAVLIGGTGPWWAGSTFRAVVADVRSGDNTVKVRYADGGYKRFSGEVFLRLVRPEGDIWESDFGAEPYEWADDVIKSTSLDCASDAATLKAVIRRLRAAALEAQKSRQVSVAESVRRDIIRLRRLQERLRLRKSDLALAVQRTDFVSAHEAQEDLRLLHADLAAVAKLWDVQQPRPAAEVALSALQRALGGGLAGAGAMVVQVLTLMWLRTTMYYQHRHGASMAVALRSLYREGGPRRFYRGILPTLVHGPLSRFGDTAANTGVFTLCDAYQDTADLPMWGKTVLASAVAALWRVVLMPVDTVKCFMQVEGTRGMAELREKRRVLGPRVYWHGSAAMYAATFVGHFPWFATYNTLDARLPVPAERLQRLSRDASIGFCASFVSDCSSNGLRVLKTYRQTSAADVTYLQALRHIQSVDGVSGVLTRGLGTRLVANGLQGMMFSVVWKSLDAWLSANGLAATG